MITSSSKVKRNFIYRTLFFMLFVLLIAHEVFTNEMPLEGFPANGIVVRDESNIQIEREVLYITSSKIEVSYVFRNISNKDITTQVAFPIPLHRYGIRADMPWDINYPIHSDFSVEINGKKQKHGEITRAFIKGEDVTDTLNRLNISIKDFNESHWRNFHKGFLQQDKSSQQKLLDLGVVEFEEIYEGESYASPAWSVETTYYWEHFFPAKDTVRVKLSYRPNPSHTKNPGEDKDFINRNRAVDPWKTDVSEMLCFDDGLKNWKKQLHGQMNTAIIDYILTTANHWKKPIKEFHLIVEAESRTDRDDERVSTCFERSKLKKINNHRYEITIKDFVPKEELSVFFVTGDIMKY